MDTATLIKSRRSVRKYKAKNVPRKLVKKILESARWAPSLHNLQPWKFIVVEGALKQKLAEALKHHKGKEFLIMRLILKTGIEMIEKAPCAILVYNNTPLSRKVITSGKSYFNGVYICETQSVACAIQNMLLTAHSLGLGATWVGVSIFRQKVINEVVGAGDNLMAVLAVGYPDEKPKAPGRKPLSEIAIFKK